MKEIQLTRGYVALIDDEDFEWLSQWSWYAFVDRRKDGSVRTVYAVRHGKRHEQLIRMHRVILDAKPGQQIDHVNGDGIDNRRANLRFCSRAQNGSNSKKQPNCSSKYKGATWCKRSSKWIAQITWTDPVLGWQRKQLGVFDDEIGAAWAYDIAALALFKDYARLNFGKNSAVDNEYAEPSGPALLPRKTPNRTSSFKGVCWAKRPQKWLAATTFEDKKIHIGSFDCEEEAAQAYDKVAAFLYSNSARLNFPASPPTPVNSLAEALPLKRELESQFRGVISTPAGNWRTTMKIGGKTTHLGTFKDELGAAWAYDMAAYFFHGENAKLNFLEEQ